MQKFLYASYACMFLIAQAGCKKEKFISENTNVVKSNLRLPNNPSAALFIIDDSVRLRAIDANTGSSWWSTLLDTRWNIRRMAAQYSSPVVYGNTVYACSSESMNAVDIFTGAIRWSISNINNPTTPTFYTDIITNKSLLYVTNSPHFDTARIHAIDPATGNIVWTYKTTQNTILTSSPLVHNGVLYIGGSLGTVYAINALTGREKWSGRLSTSAPTTSSPTIYNDKLYIGSGDGFMYALDVETGNVKWKYDTKGSIESSPTISGNKVYIQTGANNYIFALNLETGNKEWSLKTGGGSLSSPTISNGILYVGCTNGTVYATDASSGRELWRSSSLSFYDDDKDKVAFISSPVVYKDKVYITDTKNHLYALDANPRGGYRDWVITMPTKNASSPCVVGSTGTVYYPGIAGSHL